MARARRQGVTVPGDPRSLVIGRAVAFDLGDGARVVLGDGVVLDDGCRLHVGRGATVEIGSGSRLGARCVITAHRSVTLGARVLLADEVVLADGDPRYGDVERPVREQGIAATPVSVGDDVRIGPSAAILSGVTIGARALVGAHAVVTRDVAAGAAVIGVPAVSRPAPRPSAPRARGGHAPR